jgi:hypothetical protein
VLKGNLLLLQRVIDASTQLTLRCKKHNYLCLFCSSDVIFKLNAMQSSNLQKCEIINHYYLASKDVVLLLEKLFTLFICSFQNL